MIKKRLYVGLILLINLLLAWAPIVFALWLIGLILGKRISLAKASGVWLILFLLNSYFDYFGK